MTNMTIGELTTLLSTNGLPALTPVTVRVLESVADVQHSTSYAIHRVQVVRQLHTPRGLSAGQSPEFVIEILALKSVTPRPSAPYPAVADIGR